MKLKYIAKIKTNFADADFWIVRKGSESAIGKPTKEFNESHIGIKVNREIFVPDYLYYAMIHLHLSGFFRQFVKGTLNLTHLDVSDVKNIKIGE